MKRALSLVAAFVLAAGLTACANTATGPDGYGYGYGANGYNGTGYTDTYRGNVSTTPNGRVNGTNRTNRTTQTTGNGRSTTNAGTTNGANTNAMGAGMQG